MNIHQELRRRYISAGTDRQSLGDRRVARAVFVRDTVRTLYDADKKVGIDEADSDSLAALVDAAEEHLLHTSADVGHIPVETSPSRGAIT